MTDQKVLLDNDFLIINEVLIHPFLMDLECLMGPEILMEHEMVIDLQAPMAYDFQMDNDIPSWTLRFRGIVSS